MNAMTTTTLADRITTRREELGLSREDLATAASVSVTAVQQWETGKTKNLKLQHLLQITDALNVTVRWLIEGRGPKEAAPSMEAYSNALARRDESNSERVRKGWERIAAVFAKAAVICLMAITFAPSPSEATALLHKNVSEYALWPSVILIVRRTTQFLRNLLSASPRFAM